jgi:glycosyltransferase involved in cell wall biosynthesis
MSIKVGNDFARQGRFSEAIEAYKKVPQDNRVLYRQALFNIELLSAKQRSLPEARDGSNKACHSKGKPFLSIIIPFYNAEKYLLECLSSVIRQTMQDIEIICIDDGSLDGSLEIVKKLQENEPRIKLFEQENSGVSSARNLGMRKAHGECIIFVDADDYIDVRMAEVLKNNFHETKADIIVFGGETFPSKVDWISKKMPARDALYDFNSIDALFYEAGSIPFVWNKMFRTSLLKQHGFEFDETLELGEDQVFLFMVFPAAKKIQYINETLYRYRQTTDGSAMAHFGSRFKLKNNEHLRLIRAIIDGWTHQGYLSGNERHLASWIIRFLKNCAVDTPMHAAYFSKEAVRLLERTCYKPVATDEFFDAYNKISRNAQTNFAPKISVIIPVFNVENELPQCVDSLLAQTFKDFEVIFVDDGSQDGSLDILRRYEDADSRITVLQQKNQFSGTARNRAMEKATGDYLIFLDSDDFFEPALLEEMYNSITINDCDICVCSVNSYDHVTRETKPMPWMCKTKFIPEGVVFSKENKDLNKYLYCFTTPAPWNKMFKRSFVERNNLLFNNTRSANDMYFVLMALSVADKIVINAKSLVNYRRNNSTSLQETQDKDFYAFYDALSRLKNGLLSRGIYELVKTPYVNFALDFCLYNLGTMKREKTFLELYEFIKRKAFDGLDIASKKSEFFYGYTPTNGERKELVSELTAEEYMRRFDIELVK